MKTKKTIQVIVIIATFLIILIVGISLEKRGSYDTSNTKNPTERKAILAAEHYINRMENLGFNLTLKNMSSSGNVTSLYYYFDDESGPIIIEIEDGIAKYMIMEDKREPINESVSYMERGAELLTT